MLVVYVLLGVVAANDHSSTGEKTDMLLKNLRKQLTENNYDYMSNESEDLINLRAKSDESTQASTAKQTKSIESTTDEEKLLFLKKQRVSPSAGAVYTTNKYTDIDVSKNDLLYYVDDRHFISKSGATTKRYKVLKLKHKSRRSGAEHLIQEEGQEGIAIVNLGGGPIPEFRLPRARRQYMHVRGQVDMGEDILPPKNDSLDNPYVTGGRY